MTMLTVSASEKANAINWMSAGFNIYGAYDLAQSALNRKIFGKAPEGKEDTPFGKLPVYMAYRPLKTSDFFLASGDGRDSFQSKFAARASVDVSVGAFSGHVEAAYGQQVAESSQYSYANMSFREALGILVIEGLAERQYLTDEFTAALKALPDKADQSNLDRFAEFFQDFGAYFVSKILVGATLEYYVAVQQSDRMKATQISAKMNAEYNGLFVTGKASAAMSSDEEWKEYRKSKIASIRIKGGGDGKRARLNNVDIKTDDSMSHATVDKYNFWLGTVATNAAVMDFRLTGIWEVCGAKRKAVEDAFREYGDMMRPKLHVETRTFVRPGDSYAPSVFLGGGLVPADKPVVPDKGWGGYRLLVIDRRKPSLSGVKMSKLYSVPSGDGSQYQQVFAEMYKDLHDGRFVDNKYFFVLATFGALNSFPPTPKWIEQMQEAGAGPKLARWVESGGGRFGTMGITADVNYILVGIMKSGPGAGIEGLGLFPMNPPPRVPHISRADVYFYSLGAGRPYVLGRAEVKP